MADSVQQAPDSEKYCPGSNKQVPKSGYKVMPLTGERKYKCPDCGKYYQRGWDGTFNKHGFKMPSKRKRVGACADCGADVFDVDYLCADCRSK